MKELIKISDLNSVYKVSKEKMIQFKVIPLYEDEEYINVVTYKESNESKEYIEFIFGKKAKFIEVDKVIFNNVIKALKPNLDENLEEEIIYDTINKNGSDIHFEPSRNFVTIRVRIDGILSIVGKIRNIDYNQILSRVKLNGNMDIAEKRKPQDGKILIKNSKGSFDCRISTIPVIYGEKMVIRILYKEKLDHTIDSLKLLPFQQKILNKIINAETGMLIISGPTGSGKTSTLYSIISSIKDKDINITTVEDPVECNIKDINQMNVNRKINFSFAEGLRSTLRQDPDVIMVGEIRDEETAIMATRAAITGHKVYSTIHTKSSRDIFLRLEDMKVKNYLIKDSLIGTISQRLIGRLCPNCKEKEKRKIKEKEYTLYKEVGCEKCNFTGISGRRLICAIHFIDEKIRSNFNNIYNDLEFLSNEQMYHVCKVLLKEGEISYKQYKNFITGEDLIRYEENEKEFL